jgi:tryptophan-rich sensory protein
MSARSAILISLGSCFVGAILEGIAAGKNVKPLFARLRFPSYSAPLWIWYIIGVLYYTTCFFVIYRILRHDGDTVLKNASLTLVLVIMAANAFWNYLFFRAQNFFQSFVLGILYSVVAVVLFAFLIQLDKVAMWAFVPYLLYQIYALRWGYGLWKLNSHTV